MPYTRKQMINHLMWFEAEYFDEQSDKVTDHTRESWLDYSFKDYTAMDDEKLASMHLTFLDAYYGEPEDVAKLMEQDKQDLASGRTKEWV